MVITKDVKKMDAKINYNKNIHIFSILIKNNIYIYTHTHMTKIKKI